ncbi:MAG: hypothetical protein HAW63_02945, partial [Bdellovibrionaceae bacterium]|nr:hypothetical protein [Pseudobdellovibrionaceae bacterium]
SGHEGHKPVAKKIVLTEAGNDAFGTIQEIITKLSQDPTTDWSKVNLEAVRKHLLDMYDMTMSVTVVSQKPVSGGMEAVVYPTTDRAAKALVRVFNAHPAQLKKESGWDMTIKKGFGKKYNKYIVTVTTSKDSEVDKIRGFGYIGVMAAGKHHQTHHLMMAKGENAHKHEH